MRKLYLLGLIFISFMMTMCQSLEDTYSDYAGDHVIRYVGKCSDLSVVSGWKRLYVEWTNGVDPVVENIKLTWMTAGEISDTLLAPDVTSCNLLNLQDGSCLLRLTVARILQVMKLFGYLHKELQNVYRLRII